MIIKNLIITTIDSHVTNKSNV